MNEHERYLFDLNGYLVLRGVLGEQEVSTLNAAIDHHADQMTEMDRSLAGDSSTLAGTSHRLDMGGGSPGTVPGASPFANCSSTPGSNRISKRFSAKAIASITAPSDRNGERL